MSILWLFCGKRFVLKGNAVFCVSDPKTRQVVQRKYKSSMVNSFCL